MVYFSRDSYLTNFKVIRTQFVKNRSTNSQSLITYMHGLNSVQFVKNRFVISQIRTKLKNVKANNDYTLCSDDKY